MLRSNKIFQGINAIQHWMQKMDVSLFLIKIMGSSLKIVMVFVDIVPKITS